MKTLSVILALVIVFFLIGFAVVLTVLFGDIWRLRRKVVKEMGLYETEKGDVDNQTPEGSPN
jgi:hypothetical protein